MVEEDEGTNALPGRHGQQSPYFETAEIARAGFDQLRE
jgi:hypothetical protein